MTNQLSENLGSNSKRMHQFQLAYPTSLTNQQSWNMIIQQLQQSDSPRTQQLQESDHSDNYD